MLGLKSIEVYNSIFNITEENNKFELYTDTFDKFLFEELENDLEELLNASDITLLHHFISNMEKKDHVLLKHIGNKDRKNQALMVILYYYWVMLDHHFKILKVI